MITEPTRSELKAIRDNERETEYLQREVSIRRAITLLEKSAETGWMCYASDALQVLNEAIRKR